jgi:hypothetical protein
MSSTFDKSTSQHTAAYSPATAHRGLSNLEGENNCFLNVTLQALWHLGPFRSHLIKFVSNSDNGVVTCPKGGLLEALCDLFVQYQYTDVSVLLPNEIRQSLSTLSDRFKFGSIADANEAFDTILHTIHSEMSQYCPYKQKCLAHEVFGGSVMEQAICTRCKGTSEPVVRGDFIVCCQAAELIQEAQILRGLCPAVGDSSSSSSSAPVGRIKSYWHNMTHRSSRSDRSSSTHASKKDSAVLCVTVAEFGGLLRKCLAVNQRSCPSTDTAAATVAGVGSNGDCSNRNISDNKSSRTDSTGSGISIEEPSTQVVVPAGPSSGSSVGEIPTITMAAEVLSHGPFTHPVSATCAGPSISSSSTGSSSSSSSSSTGSSKGAENPSVTGDTLTLGTRTCETASAITANTISPTVLADASSPPATTTTIPTSATTAAATATRPLPPLPEPLRPACKAKATIHTYCLDAPLAVAISVGWTQSTAERATLRDFYNILAPTIRLSSLFTATPGADPSYVFRGLVCYYGLHYVSIFQHIGANQDVYMLFDDARIRPIGNWEAVKEECIKANYQPVLLLYELELGSMAPL